MLQTLAPDSSKKLGDRSEREWDEQAFKLLQTSSSISP